MITHDTPTALDAGPNSLKISEPASLHEVLFAAAADQALERKPSNAWARKMPMLIRPKTAVTASFIANVLHAPAQTERSPCCTVKRNSYEDRKSHRTDDLAQQFRLPGGANRRPAMATIDSPPHGSPHFRRVRDAISSYLDAEVGSSGRITTKCLEVGTLAVEW
jgi:hypothetical protein